MMHPSPSSPPPPGTPPSFQLRRDSFAAFAWLTGIVVVIHAFELTAFNLSIDDEIFAYSRPDALIELGRWSHAVIRYLWWDQPVCPSRLTSCSRSPSPMPIYGCCACSR